MPLNDRVCNKLEKEMMIFMKKILLPCLVFVLGMYFTASPVKPYRYQESHDQDTITFQTEAYRRSGCEWHYYLDDADVLSEDYGGGSLEATGLFDLGGALSCYTFSFSGKSSGNATVYLYCRSQSDNTDLKEIYAYHYMVDENLQISFLAMESGEALASDIPGII